MSWNYAKGKGNCRNCGRPDHWERDCPDKMDLNATEEGTGTEDWIEDWTEDWTWTEEG